MRARVVPLSCPPVTVVHRCAGTISSDQHPGGMAERTNATVLKTVGPATVPGVRIPLPPLRNPCRCRGSAASGSSVITSGLFVTSPRAACPQAARLSDGPAAAVVVRTSSSMTTIRSCRPYALSTQWTVAVLVTAVAVLGVAGCSNVGHSRSDRITSTTPESEGGSSNGSHGPPVGSGPSSSQGPVAAAPPDPGEVATALSELATLETKGRAPRTGYTRGRFGPRWADVDRNGCDTRNDVLNRDLTDRTWRPGTHDCVVLSGVLIDPYTDRMLQFSKANASGVQIDHVVALSDAWQTGAQGWTEETRRRFANDPANLLAVDGPTNKAKRDSDAASWLPPNKSFRCSYVMRQVQVKTAYRLWVTPAERDAITRVLTTCAPPATP